MSPVADLADTYNSKMAEVIHGSRDLFNTDMTDVGGEPFVKPRGKSENFDSTPDGVTTEKTVHPMLNEIVDLCLNNLEYKALFGLGALLVDSSLNGAQEDQPVVDKSTDSEDVDYDVEAKDVFDDFHFKPEDKVARMEDIHEEIQKDSVKVELIDDTDRTCLKGGNNLRVQIPSHLEVVCTAKEGRLVQSADTEFNCDALNSEFMHYNIDVVKDRPVEPVVRNDHAVLPRAPQPQILCQLAENHRRKKYPVVEFLFLVQVFEIFIRMPEVITSTLQNFTTAVAIFAGKFAPKWCGLHGEQKTAHGRSSNSGAEHGDNGQASGGQGVVSPLRGGGPGDGSGDTPDGERDKEPPRPGPSERIDDIQLPSLRHGDIKDINDEIHVVLASDGESSRKILQEMNRCLTCSRLHDDKNCPSKFCSRLTASIEHFLRRTCIHGDCTACGLVKRLVEFHLMAQAEKDETNVVVTDDSVQAFLREWFAHLDLDLDESETTIVAEPRYLGKNKGAKLAGIAEDAPRTLAGFEREQNEGAIGGFLLDSFAAGGQEHPEDGHLADVSPGSVDLEESYGRSGLGAISEELEAMSISSESTIDTRSASLGARGPGVRRQGALGNSLIQSSVGILRNEALDEPAAMTSDYFSDQKDCLYRFYEDEARTSSRPVPIEKRQPTSLPAFAKRKKVVPVRPGHIGIGGPRDLDRTCNLWERLKDTGFRQWSRAVEREAEGVFLNNDFVEEHSITVDGRYDEGTHWTRLQLIGEGCFGQVFHCQDETTKALFCIKQIALEKLEMSEIKIWGRLDHSGFCNLHGAVRVGQTVLIFMPYVGETLREFLEEQQLADLPRCLAQRLELLPSLGYFRQLLEALYFMEQKGIVHNDLKSANILIDEDTDSLKIIDFGLSHQIQPGKKYQVMRAIGTPIICSPERMRSEPYDYTADIWSSVGIFLEMLTGNYMWFPEFSEAGILTLTFKIGDLKAPPMELVPDALGLPERVLDLFRHGWDVDASRRYHAADLLKLVNGIYTDLENGTLPYEEPVPVDYQLVEEEEEFEPPTVGAVMPGQQEILSSFALKLSTQKLVVNEPGAYSLNFMNVEDETVSGRRPMLPRIGVQIPSLESKQDAGSDGNVPRFLHSNQDSSNQMVVNSLSQSLDQADKLNIPALSILDKTHSSDSFSVPVTNYNQPRNLRSSDLGSSVQQSMEYEIQMESVTTSGIDPGFHGMAPSSYCPTSEMTDASVCTLRGSIPSEETISGSEHQDDTDEQMVLSVDARGAVAPAESPQSPYDQSMPFDERSKGNSSSSDEMLEKYQQELELDFQRRQSMDDHIVEFACSIDTKSPRTPTGSGFSSWSSVSGASEARRKISDEGRPRFLEKVDEARQRNAATKPAPVVIFHKNVRDGERNEIVSFSCSKEYRRQQIKDAIDTVATRLHNIFPQFTVRDSQSNLLHLDDTIDKILPEHGHEIHLLVLEADTANDSWYIDNHEVHRSSVY